MSTDIIGTEPTDPSIKPLSTFMENLPAFETDLAEYLEELRLKGLDTAGIEIDHICLKTSSNEQAQSLSEELRKISKWVNKEMIYGRPIIKYGLKEPLSLLGRNISCIELQFPKEGRKYIDGWDHVEFVIPSSANDEQSMKESFTARFPDYKGTDLLDFDMPTAFGQEKANPTLEMKKRTGLTVKFHPHRLEDIIRNKEILE